MIFRPMLGAKAPDLDRLPYPLLASPKLDGIRCLIVDGVALSRSLKPIPNGWVQHRLSWLPSGLDGELICGEPTDPNVFSSTTKAVMRVEGRPQFCFIVFDFMREDIAHLPHAQRMDAIPDFGVNYYTEILQQRMVSSAKALERYEYDTVALGYEGVILRDPNAPYKQGRSTVKEAALLKLKRFADGEAKVIGSEPLRRNGNGVTIDERGYMKRSSHAAGKRVEADLLGALTVRDILSGVEFSIGSGFTQREREELGDPAERMLLPGRIVRYRHFPHGAVDKPRHPTFAGFRDHMDLTTARESE